MSACVFWGERMAGKIRQGLAKAGIVSIALWIGLPSTAVATDVYRCTDSRSKLTVFQDTPCIVENIRVAPASSQPAAVAVSTPVPQQIASAIEIATPIPVVSAEPATPPMPLARILAPLSWAAMALLLMSAVVLGVKWFGKRRRREQVRELQNQPWLALPQEKPKVWSLQLLQSLEWKRLEDLCAAYYRATGLQAETTPLGPDGGVDIYLHEEGILQPAGIVQCKAWRQDIGVKEVRELLGVQTAVDAGQAIFITSGAFSKEAIAFAQENGLTLLDGRDFLAKLQAVPKEQRQQLLALATEGDYTTPTCPICGQKMVEREGSLNLFWGCKGYPHCKGKLSMRGA